MKIPCEIAPEGKSLSLYGYLGDLRSQEAHIVVRRRHVGAMANDIGFSRMPDGSLEMIISEYDKTAAHSTVWNRDIIQKYAKNVVVKTASKMGKKVKKTRVHEDGTIELELG